MMKTLAIFAFSLLALLSCRKGGPFIYPLLGTYSGQVHSWGFSASKRAAYDTTFNLDVHVQAASKDSISITSSWFRHATLRVNDSGYYEAHEGFSNSHWYFRFSSVDSLTINYSTGNSGGGWDAAAFRGKKM